LSDIYTLTVSLTKLSTDDFPKPTAPEIIYKTSRLYFGADGKKAKTELKHLVGQMRLEERGADSNDTKKTT